MLTQSRMTVVETVHFERPSAPSVSAVSRFSVDLPCDRPAYQTTLTVGDSWIHLQDECPPQCAAVLLTIRTVSRQVMPTRSEREEEQSRKVLVGFAPRPLPKPPNWTQFSPPAKPVECFPCVVVSSGESCRFTPVDVRGVWLKSASGTVEVQVTVIPAR